MQRAGSFYLKPYEMSYLYLIDCEDIDFFSGKISKGLAKSISGFQLRTHAASVGMEQPINILLLERIFLGFEQLQKASGALSQQNQ